MNDFLQFIFPSLRLFLFLHCRSPFGFVYSLQLATLSNGFALVIFEALDSLLFLVDALLELGLILNGLVESGLEDLDLFLQMSTFAMRHSGDMIKPCIRPTKPRPFAAAP